MKINTESERVRPKHKPYRGICAYNAHTNHHDLLASCGFEAHNMLNSIISGNVQLVSYTCFSSKWIAFIFGVENGNWNDIVWVCVCVCGTTLDDGAAVSLSFSFTLYRSIHLHYFYFGSSSVFRRVRATVYTFKWNWKKERKKTPTFIKVNGMTNGIEHRVKRKYDLPRRKVLI